MNKSFLVGLVALGLAVTAVCAQTTYTWNGGSGSWHVATNWTPNGLPGANDAAVINAGTVQLTNSIAVSNVTINGGTLTHPQGSTNGVQLNVAGVLTVAVGGSIEVTGRGYLGGYYPGNTFPARGETRGTNGLPAAGANSSSGGSYGSPGGGSAPNPLYGSETAPVDLGSGGSSVAGHIWGGFGGGRMHLQAQSLVVDGALRANGTGSYNTQNGLLTDQGGGSGGAIYVVLNGGTFSGSGVIEARGGPSTGANVGGGGRIAIVGCFTRNFSGALTNAGTHYMNACPVLPAQTDRAPDELTLLTVTNTATDEDLTNVLTYALLAAPANATISANGVIQWLSSESDGPSTNLFTTVVSDNAKAPLFTTNSFMVVVNEINLPPALTIPPNANVNELTPFAATATATDPDIPTNPLTFALVSGPAGLTVAPTGEINWISSEAQGSGTYLVTLSVTDTNPPAINTTSLSITSSFSITVNEVNVAPVLIPPANQTINEAAAFTANATGFDADLPLNALKFELISGPAGLTISPAGAIAWTPSEDQGPGTNQIVLRLSDTNPPAVNVTSLSVTSSFELVIREVNVPPVLSLPARTNIKEMTAWAASATATDADNPTNALVFALVAGPAGLSVSPGGGISWTPTEVQGPGTNTVLISVTDTNPIAVNATSLSVTSSFEIVVSEVNVAPVLVALTDHTVNPGQTISFNATATDADLPTNILSYALVSPPPGADITSDGRFTWRAPAALADTTNTIQVRVQDNGTPVSNDVKSFTVIVNALGAPVALTPVSYSGGQFRFQISGPAGPDYVTEASTNLSDWIRVGTNQSPTLPFEFNDPAAGVFGNRVYRVRLQP